MRRRLPLLLVVPALLAALPAGCISDLAERGGPRSRGEAATPPGYPTVGLAPAPAGRLLTPAERERQAAELKAKGAASRRAAGN